jgi:hypothetical protein
VPTEVLGRVPTEVLGRVPTEVPLHLCRVTWCRCLVSCSDAFLFGARKVYRNIFQDRKFVEAYDMEDIEQRLGLDRCRRVASEGRCVMFFC